MQASNKPCAACRVQRRKCTEECIFKPHFPVDNLQHFLYVHRVFGASNVGKLLNELHASHRADMVKSLVFEAEARLRDPVYGCAGYIFLQQQKLKQIQSEIRNLKKELFTYLSPEAFEELFANRNKVELMLANPSMIPSIGKDMPHQSNAGFPPDGNTNVVAAQHNQLMMRDAEQQELFEAQQLAAVQQQWELMQNNYEQQQLQEFLRFGEFEPVVAVAPHNQLLIRDAQQQELSEAQQLGTLQQQQQQELLEELLEAHQLTSVQQQQQAELLEAQQLAAAQQQQELLEAQELAAVQQLGTLQDLSELSEAQQLGTLQQQQQQQELLEELLAAHQLASVQQQQPELLEAQQLAAVQQQQQELSEAQQLAAVQQQQQELLEAQQTVVMQQQQELLEAQQLAAMQQQQEVLFEAQQLAIVLQQQQELLEAQQLVAMQQQELLEPQRLTAMQQHRELLEAQQLTAMQQQQELLEAQQLVAMQQQRELLEAQQLAVVQQQQELMLKSYEQQQQQQQQEFLRFGEFEPVVVGGRLNQMDGGGLARLALDNFDNVSPYQIQEQQQPQGEQQQHHDAHVLHSHPHSLEVQQILLPQQTLKPPHLEANLCCFKSSLQVRRIYNRDLRFPGYQPLAFFQLHLIQHPDVPKVD